MKPSLALTAPDLQAVLSSLLRGARLHAGNAHYLFANSENTEGRTLMLPGVSGLDVAGLRSVASSFVRMLGGAENAVEQLMCLPTLGAWANAALELWQRNPSELVFMTSGSTGAPVACRQSFALLEQEIHAQAEIFQEHVRVVSLVPRHHIYGFLFSILLPKALRIPVVDLPLVPSKIQIGKMRAGDVVVAFPMFWKSLSTIGAPIPPGVCGVTSTGPCPTDVIHRLLEQGLTRMTEVYGSSETGGIGTRHNPDHAYTLLPFWEPHAEHEDESSTLLRVLPDGGTAGPFCLPDFLQWETGRHFRPLQRRDKSVQVAGVNVYPEKVADCIRSHPMVRSCSVRLMRPEEGQRLKAFIVLREGASNENLRREMRSWLNQRLTASEIPKSLTFGAALPTNSMGKDADWD